MHNILLHRRSVLASMLATTAAAIPFAMAPAWAQGDQLPSWNDSPSKHYRNALLCQAMGQSGSIHLASRVERDGANGARVAITVTDSGPGIDASRLPRVFDLFYTTKPTGTGVGLAMAKRLVERQGGSIEVVSAPGAGATFTLRLPHETAAAGPEATG